MAAFASGLDHPRWLLVLPNGDVLVAESNAPPKPEGSRRIKDYAMALVMKRAGAATPRANRTSLLRDADGDGIAETRSVLLSGFLNEPGDAMGRPVGLAIDARGALLVADDVGNVIWRVSAEP